MTGSPVPLGDCYGADTIFRFDAVTSVKLRGATFEGHALEFMWRYGPEVSSGEIACLIAAGWVVLLAWHVPRPGWHASAELGAQHGAAQVAHARSVGYPEGCDLLIDMEGVGNPGPDCIAYAQARGDACHAAGYGAVYYEGFDDGLQLSDRVAIVESGHIDKFFADFGPRVPPPGIGFVCKQFQTVTLAGVSIDPDHAFPDMRGRTLVGMGPPFVAPEDEITKVDPPDEPHNA